MNTGCESFIDGDYKEAHEYFSKCLSEESSAVAFYRRAEASLKLNAIHEALQDLNSGLELVGDEEKDRKIKCKLLFKKG